MAVPRGRSPDSPEGYHGANLLHRAEASIVVALYRRLRDADFPAGEALVGAYRHYVGICQPPHRISFDRAFDLAAHTDGLWFTDTRSFSLVTCPTCHSEFLAAYGSVARSNDHCLFCKLVQRYGTDPRVQGGVSGAAAGGAERGAVGDARPAAVGRRPFERTPCHAFDRPAWAMNLGSADADARPRVRSQQCSVSGHPLTAFELEVAITSRTLKSLSGHPQRIAPPTPYTFASQPAVARSAGSQNCGYLGCATRGVTSMSLMYG